ncbi:MAG: transposase, partial [Xanthomonadales bacterium]|nr:transposase [Xanthomonadales bacterium]
MDWQETSAHHGNVRKGATDAAPRGLSIGEIARRTSLSRNTIKAWLRASTRSEDELPARAGSKKLDGHREWLRQAPEIDARRPGKERRTALRLFAQLQAEALAAATPGAEAIRAWRAESSAVTARSAFVPLRFEWGGAYQFDWSEEGIVIGGVWREGAVSAHEAVRVTGLLAGGLPAQSHGMLFDAHLRCLTGLGGIARRGIYDNMKTAVDRVPGRGRARIINARFTAMTAHYLIDPDFCNMASEVWEKGRVEKARTGRPPPHLAAAAGAALGKLCWAQRVAGHGLHRRPQCRVQTFQRHEHCRSAGARGC